MPKSASKKQQAKKRSKAYAGSKMEPGRETFGLLPGTVTRNVPALARSSLGILGVKPTLRETLGWAGTSAPALGMNTFADLQQIILNSPYDPDAALGGISARGFAKLMALYSKAFVIGANITADFSLGGGAGGGGVPQASHVVGITITTLATPLTSIVQAMELGYTEHRLVNDNPDSVRFALSVDIANFLSKPDVLDDPQLFCTSGANPGQVVVAHLWVQNMSLTTATGVTTCAVVNYETVFTDPIPFT